MSTDEPQYPWLEGVQGSQVLPIINCDDPIIRVEAGPGTGKTFGLVRRVQRILHPSGLGIHGDQVIVVAFNRVIAKQLRQDIEKCLSTSPHSGKPVVETIHALCLSIIGTDLRILLPHEREAMLYDVLEIHPELKQKYEKHAVIEQALFDHEAGHNKDKVLWQAVQEWMVRHNSQLISDLPSLLLDKLHGGDLADHSYRHVIVDEFQDLTSAEQKLVTRLRGEKGNFVALGDSRQSIYRFRGNDRDGLGKVPELVAPLSNIPDPISMNECRRCPREIVEAANQLMGLYAAQKMSSTSGTVANIHVVHWQSPEAEAQGMAKAIVDNIKHNTEISQNEHTSHLAMVTRRQFGFSLREEISKLDPEIRVDLSFSESLLETWSVREAFLFFCLLVDPDAPTWRAWLGYQNQINGSGYKAKKRNSDAYLRFLAECNDEINENSIHRLANNSNQPPGSGGKNLHERARRFVELKKELYQSEMDSTDLLNQAFDATRWVDSASNDAKSATDDMETMLTKSVSIYQDLRDQDLDALQKDLLQKTAQQLRYHIATREPFIPDENADLQITTFWGAKGITADHVYVIGLCDEAIPGIRRKEYPGTAIEYFEEQRRLFYVSITRARNTLVLSRFKWLPPGKANRLGFHVPNTQRKLIELGMSRFLRDIIEYLPQGVAGDKWEGC